MSSESATDRLLNAADENPPSRPGVLTTAAFLVLLGAILLYINWHSAKGFFGFE
jgi:hypothetical protein